MKRLDIETLVRGSASDTSRRNRGQTLQDFVVGISIFILAFVLAISLMPGVLSPFTPTVGTQTQATAERVSGAIVANLSEPAAPNSLNETRVDVLFNQSGSNLHNRFGLAESTQINITLEELDGLAQINTTGDYRNRDRTGQSGRIVTVNDSSCDPACRLVVRTW